MRRFALLLGLALCWIDLPARAETYTLTLKQAVDRALAQNPEIVMARMDELKATLGVRYAASPFVPRVDVGSGAAYTNGFPLSIDGSAPAVVQARANEYLYNKPQRYAIAQAKESARGAGFASGEKSDEIAFRVASLYIDLDRAARLAESAAKQVSNLEKVMQAAVARVEEGRELAVTGQEANVNLLRARQRLMVLESDRDYSGHNLAATLGYPAGDVVQPAAEERAAPAIPETEAAALQAALLASKELKRLDSNLAAKDLEIKGDKAQRLPRVDLVAQYALLSKFNNYAQYYNQFKRNNEEIGASVQVPIFTGTGVHALVGQAESDQQHLRAEMQAARNRLTLDIHQSYLDIRKADVARELAQADLDLARSQLSIVLAQLNEGRAQLRQVEEARFNEEEKWIAFYDAQFASERARWNVLRETGELRAALQ
jgi:outer membrane protein TolC